MAFTGDEGELIDPALAQKWIDNYQKTIAPGGIKGEFIGFRKLNELMSQEDAIGVRIYYAKNDEGVNTIVLVAVTSNEANIANIDGSRKAGLVFNHTKPCPPYCSPQ